MAKVWDTKQVRQRIEEMRFGEEELGPAEIHRRLHANEAGLPWPVTISKRQVNYYITDIRERRIREAADNPNAASDEVAQLERRMIDRLRQEVAYIERKRLGRLTPEDLRKLNTAHRSLIDIEKRTRKFTKRKLGGGPITDPAKPESELERMAREEAERQAEATSAAPDTAQSVPTDQEAPVPTRDSEGAGSQRSEQASDGVDREGTSTRVDRCEGQSLSTLRVIQARRAAATAGHPA